MPRDPLASLIRIRRLACDDAERAVARCTAAEAAAASAAAAAERDIAREAEAAAAIDGGDDLVEAFAAWLPSARKRSQEAAMLHERYAAETGRARAILAGLRTALESIEALVAERAQAQTAALARRAQADLDEVCRHGADATDGSTRPSGP